MTLAQILALPVGRLADRNSVLVLWTPCSMLKHALEVAECWGFAFKTCGAWAKRSRLDRRWAFGTGYVLRDAAELFIIATRGSPRRASRSERNLIVAPVREHSRKPTELHGMLRRMYPTARRVELFGRERHRGWTAWGDEVGKFNVGAV
jgi:N6-adenosine-specific RNA methylase IME4